MTITQSHDLAHDLARDLGPALGIRRRSARYQAFTGALLAALALTGTALIAAPDALAQKKKEEAPKGPSVSKAMTKPLSEAQKAIAANDLATAKAKIAEARAVPNQTAYDQYVVEQFAYQVAVTEKDNAAIVAGLKYMSTSEFIPADERVKVLRNLMGFAINDNDFATALAYGQQLAELDPNNPDVFDRMGRIALRQKNFAAADQHFSRAIQLAEAAGRTPEEEAYLMLASTREQARDPRLEETLRAMVTKYPTARNWNFLLYRFQDRTRLAGVAGIDLYRLMLEVGAMEQEGEYVEFAEVALQASPGETRRVLDRAKAAGKLTDRSKAVVSELSSRANALIAVDQKDLPGFEARAKAAKTGPLDGQLGDAFLSYGQHQKAVEAYERAIAKGGLKSLDDVYMRLGIAKLALGDKAGALAAFGQVKTDPKKVELAGLWALHANAS